MLFSVSGDLNSTNGKDLSVWNPYVNTHLLCLVFGLILSIVGGIFTCWIIQGRWNKFMARYQGYIGCILAGNWGLLFAECILGMEYFAMVYAENSDKNSSTLADFAMMDSSSFLLLYIVGWLIAYVVIAKNKNNWDTGNCDNEM